MSSGRIVQIIGAVIDVEFLAFFNHFTRVADPLRPGQVTDVDQPVDPLVDLAHDHVLTEGTVHRAALGRRVSQLTDSETGSRAIAPWTVHQPTGFENTRGDLEVGIGCLAVEGSVRIDEKP